MRPLLYGPLTRQFLQQAWGRASSCDDAIRSIAIVGAAPPVLRVSNRPSTVSMPANDHYLTSTPMRDAYVAHLLTLMQDWRLPVVREPRIILLDPSDPGDQKQGADAVIYTGVNPGAPSLNPLRRIYNAVRHLSPSGYDAPLTYSQGGIEGVHAMVVACAAPNGTVTPPQFMRHLPYAWLGASVEQGGDEVDIAGQWKLRQPHVLGVMVHKAWQQARHMVQPGQPRPPLPRTHAPKIRCF